MVEGLGVDAGKPATLKISTVLYVLFWGGRCLGYSVS